MSMNTKIVMKLFVVTCCIVFAQSGTLPKRECPQVCPALYSPVCATNGDSYSEFANPCMLDSSNCRMETSKLKRYEQIDPAWCNTKPVENMNAILGNLDLSRPECTKPCTMIYMPLCVANDKYRTTISSKCVLDMYNCVLGLNGADKVFRIIKEDKC